MCRRQVVILGVLLFIGVVSLAYSSLALADLKTFDSTVTDIWDTTLVLSPDPAISLKIPDHDLKDCLLDAQTVIERRLDKLSLTGTYQVAVEDGQLEVSLSKNENLPYLANIVTTIGQIEFIDGGTASPPLGRRIKVGPQADPAHDIYQALFTGDDVENIIPPDPAAGQIFYSLVLKPAAVTQFDRFIQTNSNSNPYVCVVVDERVVNCSTMYHWSHNTLEILPNLSGGTMIGISDLVVFTESGILPVPLKIVAD